MISCRYGYKNVMHLHARCNHLSVAATRLIRKVELQRGHCVTDNVCSNLARDYTRSLSIALRGYTLCNLFVSFFFWFFVLNKKRHSAQIFSYFVYINLCDITCSGIMLSLTDCHYVFQCYRYCMYKPFYVERVII